MRESWLDSSSVCRGPGPRRPRRFHPVAGLGGPLPRWRLATTPPPGSGGGARRRTRGAAAGTGVLLDRMVGPRSGRVLLTAAATWAVLGGRSLEREAVTIRDQLAAGDLAAARRQVRNLVGRDPPRSHPMVARATVGVGGRERRRCPRGPTLLGRSGGVPGLLSYRAINTLDAMIGHRSPRYREFGWAAARLDDLANWLPARLTVGAQRSPPDRPPGRATSSPSLPAMRRHTLSPNAGPVEAAFAAALGVSLGGSNTYDGVVEDRGRLGDGPVVTVADLGLAVHPSGASG